MNQSISTDTNHTDSSLVDRSVTDQRMRQRQAQAAHRAGRLRLDYMPCAEVAAKFYALRTRNPTLAISELLDELVSRGCDAVDQENAAQRAKSGAR